MLQGPGGRKQEEQHGSLRPSAHGRAAPRNREHEKMNVERPHADPGIGFLRGKPRSRQTRNHVKRHRPRWLRCEVACQTEDRAQGRGHRLGLPSVQLGFIFRKTDLARQYSGQRKVAPAPELRHGRTADARHGHGSVAFSNGKALLSDRLQRVLAARAAGVGLQEPAVFRRWISLNVGQ